MATVRTATRARIAKPKPNRKRKPAAGSEKGKSRVKATAGSKAKKIPKKKPKNQVDKAGGFSFGRSAEVTGVLTLGVSIFLLTSLVSLQFSDGLWMGPFGRSFAVMAYSLFGVGAHIVAVAGALLAIRLLMERDTLAKANHVIGITLGLLSFGVLLHLIGNSYLVAGYGPGGLIGQNLAEWTGAWVSTAGTALLASVALLVAIVIATPVRMRSLLVLFGATGTHFGQSSVQFICRVARDVGHFSGEVIRAILPERDHDEYLDEEEDEYYDDEEELEEDAAINDPPIIDARSGPVDAIPSAELDGDTERLDESHIQKIVNGVVTGKVSVSTPDTAVAAGVPEAKAEKTKGRKKKTTMPGVGDALDIEGGTSGQTSQGAEPVIVTSEFLSRNSVKGMQEKEAKAEEERLDFIKLAEGEYQLPSLDYLNFDANREAGIDRSVMLELSAKLVQTLENYGVKGSVAAIRPGPVVTMYEFAPAPGTRINKIVNLSDDLAMSLEAMKVRIVAPIPGKAAVGIEVPNKTAEMVFLKEIIADESFREGKMSLPMSLGKDIEGAPTSIDLAKMPHLLVAGTTGSGKSVSVNSMITSLLYNSSPEEVRMIMIDPKMLELSIYEGIPHLLLPVVTDPKKANLALRWAVDEMERRYGLLAKMGVRDIKNYNKKLGKQRVQWKADELQRQANAAKRVADDGDTDFEDQPELPFGREQEEPGKDLPFIVVVIDEFADLMMCAPKEVETSVARIAQKARAAGIHLILATQRPSVDVITGLIKANFPSRIAFRVSSKVDSRTILDQSGAENLLGSGDMLFCDRGAAPVRLHGCYVDEEEIHKVVEFLKTQGKPVYNLDIVKPREDEEDEDGDSDSKGPADALYDQAVQIVAEAQRVSVSYLQRRLSVGYNRSAKLVERMEKEGVVSPPDNKKQREVLIAA